MSLKDVDWNDISRLLIEVKFDRIDKLLNFIQKSRQTYISRFITVKLKYRPQFSYLAKIVVDKEYENFDNTLSINTATCLEPIVICDVTKISIDLCNLHNEFNVEIDCPGAILEIGYSDRDQLRRKIDFFPIFCRRLTQKCSRYLNALTLNHLLNSTSKIRNLTVYFIDDFLDQKEELSLNVLLRLMRIVCGGILRLEDRDIWNAFLTQELYDPRILGLISEFGYEFSKNPYELVD
jgi:hypothetical protein